MLQLVLGRAGYGKTEYVFSSIKKLVDTGEDDILLITPEQFSFIAERRLLEDLGESKVNCAQNSSFSRLTSEIHNIYGNSSLPVLSKGAKAVMMKKAIETVSDGLSLFNNCNNNSFITSAIKVYDEMKSCRVSTDDIIKASNNTDKEILSRKLKDIALIIDAYDALIKDKYLDSANELTELYHQLLKVDYFKDRYVFIDGFSGFVAQEYKIIEVILKQAKAVYITFCTDSYINQDKYNLFSYINSNIAILNDVAKKINVEVKEPIILDVPKRFKSENIKAIESNVFSSNDKIIDYIGDDINIFCSNSLSDECDYVARSVSRLLRKGYRASDITVICREMDKYENELKSSFLRFGVPFFNDERQQISTQPVIMFVNFLLRSVIYSYRSDDIFSLLKTGLTNLDNDKVNTLENYTFLWNINGSKWKTPFTQSTRGFVENISEEDKALLDDINESRDYVITRLQKFSSKIKSKNCKEICTAIYYALLSFGANDRLRDMAYSLERNGKSALASEQGRVWDLLMDILDKLATITEDEIVSPKEFYRLFNLMVSNEDLGSIPTGLDNVQLGSADRIRCDNPKVVFILGANEGEFPQNVLSSGLLSQNDRLDLINNDFKLYSYGETFNAQEKYFAYMALSSASEKLYVTYNGSSIESSIITSIRDMFNGIDTITSSDESIIDKIESIDNAFDILASSYTIPNKEISSLKKYFESVDGYKNRLSAVERLVKNEPVVINDKNTAKDLFKNNMYLSASRVEDYYNCAFRYFCKFGINARPRTKAEMDPMQTGTVIHYVLEQLISLKGKDGLVTLEDSEITDIVNELLNDFMTTKMGDSSEFTPRFIYQFMRLSRILVSVVKRLRDEFLQSDFEPKAFELKIGNGTDDEPVKSKHLTLSDGGSIEIRGSIDRVDTFEENGLTYVRVVDYKSGDKKFLLSDILYGLNLQMFIYLFALCEDNHELSGVSSGVLYMHSAKSVENLDRNPSDKDLNSKDNSNYKMKGIILNDDENELAVHMEHDLTGKFIPVKMTKSKGLTGSLASLAELGMISRKVDSLIISMGDSLHNGLISPNPVNGKHHDKTCEFCDYSNVCMNFREVTTRELEQLDDAQAMNKLKEECDNA